VEFSLKKWLQYYDDAHILGNYLRDSTREYNPNTPENNMAFVVRRNIEAELAQTLKNCSTYLNRCHMPLDKDKKKYISEYLNPLFKTNRIV